jgi:phospholipid/cholesterol/gamma-HCH transport system substrate-binding protein
MAPLTRDIRDGILFLIGLAGLLAVIVLLTRTAQEQDRYSFAIRFDQAQNIPSGAAVLMSGVPIGQVDQVSLEAGTNKSLVAVRVFNSVLLHEDDIFAIASGGLVGDKYVAITPKSAGGLPVRPNTIVDGVSSPDINDVLASTNTLLGRLDETTRGLNGLLNDRDTHRHIKQTISNFDRTSLVTVEMAENLRALLTENRAAIASAVADFAHTSRASSELATGLSRLLQAHQGDLDATLASLRQTSGSTAALAEGLNQLAHRNSQAIDLIVADLGGVAKDIKAVSASLALQIAGSPLLKNLEAATENTTKLTERLNHAAAAVDVLLNDKELAGALRDSAKHLTTVSANLAQMTADGRKATGAMAGMTGDIQATAANVREASAGLKAMSTELPLLVKPFSEAAPKAAENLVSITTSLRDTSAAVSGTANKLTQMGRSLAAFHLQTEGRFLVRGRDPGTSAPDMHLAWRNPSSLLRVGVTEIGEANRVDGQVGTALRPNLWLRTGLMQSTFGAGADYLPTRNLRLTGELFSPRAPRANANVDCRLPFISPNLWLGVGWSDIFDDQRNTVRAGVVYRP